MRYPFLFCFHSCFEIEVVKNVGEYGRGIRDTGYTTSLKVFPGLFDLSKGNVKVGERIKSFSVVTVVLSTAIMTPQSIAMRFEQL